MEKAEGRRIVYPFTAIVGQEMAKLALLCVAVNPTIGGVLLSGDKGTGKSTLVRALADLLPEIEVVDGCPFNCNPRNPLEMCDECYRKFRDNRGKLKIAKRKMRVVDLPLSITVDRLVGTLDIKRAIREGIRALQPGLLAEANRNILYIDEVNLLDDYIADVLLDSAAMGWNIIEREGISVRHPARFILVGSMNPEEGELRPQILDRFGLYVNIEAINDPGQRMEIVRRVEEFHSDPEGFYRKYMGKQEELRRRILRAKEILPRVEISDDMLKLLAETVIRMGVRTHRAEIVTVKTAKTIAALEGRERVTMEDLKKAMELALPHRMKARPFEQIRPPEQPPMPTGGGEGGHRGHERRGGEGMDVRGTLGAEARLVPGDHSIVYEPGNVELVAKYGRGSLRSSSLLQARGSRDERATVIDHPHGYPISYVQPRKPSQARDIDITATICHAAMRSRGPPIRIEPEDVRVRVRKSRVPRLTVILLDSSGSMAVMRRIRIAKAIGIRLVEQSYAKRDNLSLICFRGTEAEVVVPITRQYSKVVEALRGLPTGGRTPLSSALYKLLVLARCFRMKNRNGVVRAILITDGKANVPMYGRPIKEELEMLSTAIRRSGIRCEIYDTRYGLDFSPSYIDLLAELLNAPVYSDRPVNPYPA